jgi:hypothetical protein
MNLKLRELSRTIPKLDSGGSLESLYVNYSPCLRHLTGYLSQKEDSERKALLAVLRNMAFNKHRCNSCRCSRRVPFSLFGPCRNGKAKLGSNKSHNLRRRNFLHPKCPAWKAQIPQVDGKAELVVNPAMLANEMKIIGAQSVVPDTFVKVACGRR